MIKNVYEARGKREDVEYEIDAFLRSKGWNHTSSTPGCLWMWEREIDGRRVLVDKEHALSMQAHFDWLEELEKSPASSDCSDEN